MHLRRGVLHTSSVVSSGNGWTFSDFRSIRLFLAEYLWGVCNTTLPGYVYLIDGWYRCAYVGAYCIRPSIISSGNGWPFSDFRSIHSSLAGWLCGVSITPLHGYTYLIDGWYRCACVGAYCIRLLSFPTETDGRFQISGLSIHPLRNDCGAYAFATYTGTRIW